MSGNPDLKHRISILQAIQLNPNLETKIQTLLDFIQEEIHRAMMNKNAQTVALSFAVQHYEDLMKKEAPRAVGDRFFKRHHAIKAVLDNVGEHFTPPKHHF